MDTDVGFPQTAEKIGRRMLASYLIFLSPIVSIVLVLGPVRWAQELLFNARGQQELDLLFYPAIVYTVLLILWQSLFQQSASCSLSTQVRIVG